MYQQDSFVSKPAQSLITMNKGYQIINREGGEQDLFMS